MTAMRKLTLPVTGLACGGGGARTVEKVVARVAGVRTVYVNPASETAWIEYDPDRCRPEQLRAAIESAGYRVPPLSRPHDDGARP
jgi:copper chaperone CopZ